MSVRGIAALLAAALQPAQGGGTSVRGRPRPRHARGLAARLFAVSLRKFALILTGAVAGSASAEPSATTQTDPPQVSIIRGELRDSWILGTAACSTDPQAICEDVLIEARIEVVEQLAGPRVAPRVTIRYIAHVPIPRGSLNWLLIWQNGHPYRPAAPLRVTNDGERRRYCFDEVSLAHFGSVPAGGTMSGESRCYRR
jgi:hypothetical protein